MSEYSTDISHDDLALVDDSLLPPQIRQMSKLIGLPDTLNLLQARGGAPLYIPAQASENCCWAKSVSRGSFLKLISEHGGQTLDLPKADKVLKQLRDIYIVNACKQKSGRGVARELGLTYRMVKYVKANSKEDDPNGDLFSLDTMHRDRQA